MLIKHGAIYLLSRIVPGLVAFASIVAYTRLLAPDEYGVYVLVIATVSLLQAIVFSWLDLSLLRILPAHQPGPERLLATVLGLFLLLIAASTVLAGLLWIFTSDPILRGLIPLGIPILWVHAWMELNLKLCQSELMPVRYGVLLTLRAAATFLLGVALVLYGLGAEGVLVGFLVGSALACVATITRPWRGIRPRLDGALAKELAVYGLPLTGAVALAAVIATTDRYLIAHFLGSDSVGMYSAAYDFTSQSLQMLMMAVNLAAYPLAIRAYESGGIPSGLAQMRENGNLLFSVAIPAAAGLALLAHPIAETVLGEQYREAARLIIPWISLAVFIAGAKAFYFDAAFQLSRKSVPMLWSVGAGAILNFLLNILWIPAHGVMGAVFATLASHAVALLVCIVVGRRYMAVRPDGNQLVRILLATVAMALVLTAMPADDTPLGLALRVAVGALAYVVAAAVFDVLRLRSRWLTPAKGP